MKTKKMTKAEKIAAYKAEKAAAKLLKEQHSLLADYIASKAEVIITNMPEAYHHDCLLMAKVYKDEETLEQNIRMLYGGECKLFKSMPGRFTFPVASFFEYAKTSNPHLFGVLPTVLVALYKEGMIDFILSEEKDLGNMVQATFNIIRL